MENVTMRQLIQRLLDSEVSAYRIREETGMATSTLFKLRSGESKVDNITLANAEKLAAYQLELEKAGNGK